MSEWIDTYGIATEAARGDATSGGANRRRNADDTAKGRRTDRTDRTDSDDRRRDAGETAEEHRSSETDSDALSSSF